MNQRKISMILKVAIIVAIFTVGHSGICVSQSYCHGGKTHGDTTFTAFHALQKATLLYDKLIASGKLSEEWETGLITVNINTRQSAGKQEYVVQFKRSAGDPDSVFFFFDQKGTYSGSNFSGK